MVRLRAPRASRLAPRASRLTFDLVGSTAPARRMVLSKTLPPSKLTLNLSLPRVASNVHCSGSTFLA